MAKGCTYKLPGIDREFTENELKAYLLDGGLQDAIDSGDISLEEQPQPKTLQTDTGKGKEPPSKPPTTEEEESDETGKRRFSQQVIKSKEILPQVKKGVRAAMDYTIQTNSMSLNEAQEILERIGEDEAYNLVTANSELKPAVRVVLGQTLIKKFNSEYETALKNDDTETANYYLDKTIDLANYVSEKLGTEAGQMIQALSLFGRLTPEAQLRAASKQVKENDTKRVKKRKKDIDNIGSKLQQANEEAADELTSSKKVKSQASKASQKRMKNAQDRAKAAKDKRQKLIDKFKKGGGSITLSSGGLSSEGIEFVGNLAKTYLDEGIANVQVIAEKIIQTLSDLGVEVNETVSKNLNDIIQENVDRVTNKQISKSLSELEQEIGKTIREHYTIPEEAKTSLTDKFINDVGLDESDAKDLAKQVEEEFSRIVSRKKSDILYKEKERLERIKKLDRKKEPRTLADDIIKYSNLGAFDNEQFTEFLKKKLNIGKLTEEEAKKIQELAKKIEKAPEGSPKREATEDLLSYRANMKGINPMETAQAIWYANILSGYATHLRNIVSTFFNGTAFFAAEALRNPKSIPVLMYGGLRGLHRGGYEAYHTVTTGRSPIHISKVETPGALERQKFIGGFFNPYNYLKFVGRLMVAEDVLQFQALKEMRATQQAYKDARKMGYSNPFSKQVWKQIDKNLLNTEERSKQAIQQAEEEGLKPKSVEWKRRVYEIMENNRPIDMTEDAYGFAAKGTFNHPTEGTLGAMTNAIAQALDQNIGGIRPLRFFVPFTRIITNVVNNALDFGPVGLIRAARGKRGFETLDKGASKGTYKELTPEERKQLVARASLGIAMTGALYALTKVPCKDGHNVLEITGGGTGDYKKDAQLKQTGWQPFSIRVCGGSYLSYKYTPLIFNLGLIGYLEDNNKYRKDNDTTAWKKIMLGLYQTGQLALDNTWVGSTSDLMKTFAESTPDRLASGVNKSLQNIASQGIMPNAYTQAAQQVEEIMNLPQKQVDGMWDRMLQHVPIARNKLKNKINALGEEIPTDYDFFISENKPHKVWDFLNEKKIWIPPINKNSLIILDQKTGEERAATGDEYYNFSKLRGAYIKEEVEKLMDNGVTIKTGNQEDEKRADDLSQAELNKVIRKIKSDATKKAKTELFSPEGGEPKPKKERVIIDINE